MPITITDSTQELTGNQNNVNVVLPEDNDNTAMSSSVPHSQEKQPETTIYGLTAAELNDANSITVTVSDKKAPLIILFGPPACGKTMTLVRMARFLRKEGYIVSPIRSFRPTEDTNYAYICEHFNATMNSNKAAGTTDRISFMLVEVIKNGQRICQILEAPGEHYFDPTRPYESFPSYVNTIISDNNRKIWTIMVEPHWKNHTDRLNYVDKIKQLKQKMRSKDSVVFVLNKIDLTNFVRGIGDVNTASALRDVENDYPGIFAPFENQNPITKLFKEWNCEFVPFQTGTYKESSTGLTYQEGPREYCVRLWKCIMNKIKG